MENLDYIGKGIVRPHKVSVFKRRWHRLIKKGLFLSSKDDDSLPFTYIRHNKGRDFIIGETKEHHFELLNLRSSDYSIIIEGRLWKKHKIIVFKEKEVKVDDLYQLSEILGDNGIEDIKEYSLLVDRNNSVFSQKLMAIFSEESDSNIAIAKQTEIDIEPYVKDHPYASIIKDIIEDHPMVKQRCYKFLPSVITLLYDEYGTFESYLDIILECIHNDCFYSNMDQLPSKDTYTTIDYFSKEICEYKQLREIIIEKKQKDTSHYNIVPIKDFESVARFSKYTEWCIAHSESDYENYTDNGEMFYVCMHKDFEDVEKQLSEGFPWDEYGKSLIAVSVNRHGLIETVTSRWNIERTRKDNMDDLRISELIGRNFYKVFKPKEIS